MSQYLNKPIIFIGYKKIIRHKTKGKYTINFNTTRKFLSK